MKKFLTVLAMLSLVACGKSSEDIEITFDVHNPVAGTVVLAYHYNMVEIQLDDNGHGTCTVTGVGETFANVFYGMDRKMVYLEKGDKVHIEFDGNDFKGTFKFEGDKSPAVEYLNTVALTEFSQDKYALPFGEFKAMLSGMEAEAQKLLDARDMRGTGNFKRMEQGRIRYSYASPLIVYPVGHRFVVPESEFVPSDDYYNTIREYFVEDEVFADVDQYREFMVEAAHILDASNRNITGYYPKIVGEMRYIADNCRNVKVRETLIHHLAAPYVDIYGIDDVQDLVNIHRTYVSDSVMVADFQNKYDKWNKTKPGKQSPDFSAADINGKVCSLKDFKGKYVYIDMWATWCRPCQNELPYMKKLAEEFEGKNIVFLGLSIDQNKSKWEEKVKSGELCGVQLYLGTGSAFQNDYMIKGIPRFILLDREGRIINENMSRPSSEETVRVLNGLEGI